MRFYTRQHRHTCGVDLHARTMYVCVLDAEGEVVLHRNLPATPEAFLRAVAPFRDDLVVACECIYTGYWLADLCARQGIAFVLGHAHFMKAIHRGKAKNDRIDALKIARLLRGGMLPRAYVYPAGMRATRDLLRRRQHLVRKRGQVLAHIQMTAQQYNLPPLGKRIAYPANREGVADHFPDPAATCTSSGPSVRRRCCSSATAPRARSSEPGSRSALARARPSRCWPTSSAGPSTSCRGGARRSIAGASPRRCAEGAGAP